jgi:ribonuclease III
LANPEDLQSILKIEFKNKDLLRQAFVHSSYLNENPEFYLPDNERLEFLGDAVLNLVVAEMIFGLFPKSSEGSLTEIRVSLIREETLAQLAAGLSLGDYLLLSKGEENSGGRNKQSNLADTYESLIGAIFLDFDLEAARQFIIPRMEHYVSEYSPIQTAKNYKGKLQEYFQTEFRQLPVYRLIDATGPDHDRNFTVEVVLDSKVLGTGNGKNKKAAEMNAARAACEQLGVKA